MSSVMVGLAVAAWLAAFTPSSHAAVYRTVDDQGNVTFSDTPSDDAKEVTPETLNTYRAEDTPRPTFDAPMFDQGDSETATPWSYDALVIVAPENDETVRDNAGMLLVEARIAPELKTDHRAVLLIDGEPGEESRTLTFQLGNVDRGTHSAAVAIVDANGAELIRSAPVTFHMQRTSVQSRARARRNNPGL